MEEKKEHAEHHHEHHEHHETKKKNDWKTLSIILGIIAIVLLGFIIYERVGGVGSVSGDAAGKKLVDFLNTRTGGGVTYVSSISKGNLYEVTVSYQQQDIPVYITKDGKYFVQAAIPLDTSDSENTNSNSNTNTQQQEITKSDKPLTELFVMTHCPYGTQAEKGIINAINTLGTNADVKIRFVHYFMHGDKEEKETYNQVCIREEQNSKYLSYLSCFLEDGDSARCLTKAGIDQTKLNACLANNYSVAKNYYKIDSELSNRYGVQGSPTLVVNGVQVDSGRDSQSFLTTICSAFKKQPSQCSVKLSTASPNPGFGTGTAAAGSNTNAQC